MPLTDDERLAYNLLTTLNPEDLASPLDAIHKVLPILEQARASTEAKLDKLQKKTEVRDRGDLIRSLVRWQDLTLEEATQFVDEKHTYEFEYGPCRVCKGRRGEWAPGCAGGSYQKCRKCNGKNSGNQLRLRLPWAPGTGPAIAMDELYPKGQS